MSTFLKSPVRFNRMNQIGEETPRRHAMFSKRMPDLSQRCPRFKQGRQSLPYGPCWLSSLPSIVTHIMRVQGVKPSRIGCLEEGARPNAT